MKDRSRNETKTAAIIVLSFVLVCNSSFFNLIVKNNNFNGPFVPQSLRSFAQSSPAYQFGPISYAVNGANRILSETSCWQFDLPPCYDNTTEQTEVFAEPSQGMVQINISAPADPFPANDSIQRVTSELALGLGSSNPGEQSSVENRTGTNEVLSLSKSFNVNSSENFATISFQIDSCFYENSSSCSGSFSNYFREIYVESLREADVHAQCKFKLA